MMHCLLIAKIITLFREIITSKHTQHNCCLLWESDETHKYILWVFRACGTGLGSALQNSHSTRASVWTSPW